MRHDRPDSSAAWPTERRPALTFTQPMGANAVFASLPPDVANRIRERVGYCVLRTTVGLCVLRTTVR
jgi:hypothetical protein